MSFTDLSDLVNKTTGGASGSPEHIPFSKDSRIGGSAAVAPVAGRWTSLWQYNGSPGGGGAAPGGTARNPTNATAGSMFQTDPGGGRTKYLLSAFGSVSTIGTLDILDRLADISGLSGNITTLQTIASLSVTRYTGTAATGNRIFLEIYTQIGATLTTITTIYTNEAGTGSRTSTVAFGGTGLREAQRWIPVPLQAGDKGVRSVESVQVITTATGTAGDFGVTIARPLVIIPSPIAAMGYGRDFISGQPPAIDVPAGACYMQAWLANTTTAPTVNGHLGFAETT